MRSHSSLLSYGLLNIAFDQLSKLVLGSANNEDIDCLVDDIRDEKDDESGVYFDAEETKEQDELSFDSSDDDYGSRI